MTQPSRPRRFHSTIICALVLAPLLVLGLTACASSPQETAMRRTQAPESSAVQAAEPTPTPTEHPPVAVPVVDTDGDKIIDEEDQCPNYAETFNGYEDEDGCPDEIPGCSLGSDATLIVVNFGAARGSATRRPTPMTGAPLQPTLGNERDAHSPEAEHAKESRAEDLRAERLALRDERSARKRSPAKALAQASALSPESESVLAKAASVLSDFPKVRVEISGHSDAREGRSDAVRDALSQARAEAVRDSLVNTHGIDPARLDLRAAGASEPVDTNETARGRAKNRRVEFRMLTQ